MATAPPPVIKIGPPPAGNKKTLSQKAVFDRYVNAHSGLKPYAQGIYRNALAYGIDPVYFASLINTESGGNPAGCVVKGCYWPRADHASACW